MNLRKKNTSIRTLKNARDYFRSLIERNSSEREWQMLFANYPCIFSESLPLRLHPKDIIPLGRPGKTEPDFIFYPKNTTPPFPYGVIEIKRPDTPILKLPRQNIITLSSSTNTALAQAQEYSQNLKSKIITRADELLIVGNEAHIFLIIGMSKEIFDKVTSDILRNKLNNLVPLGCRIIPYDTLLALFESKVQPALHYLYTYFPNSQASIQNLITTIETEYTNFKGYYLDENMFDKWNSIENEFHFITTPYFKEEKLIVRKAFEISNSRYEKTKGLPPLATEAPNPAMFALRVCNFISRVIKYGRKLGIQSVLSTDVKKLWEDSGAYASD
jgi:hypothetical protein